VLVVIAARWTYWSIRKRMALAEGRRIVKQLRR